MPLCISQQVGNINSDYKIKIKTHCFRFYVYNLLKLFETHLKLCLLANEMRINIFQVQELSWVLYLLYDVIGLTEYLFWGFRNFRTFLSQLYL